MTIATAPCATTSTITSAFATTLTVASTTTTTVSATASITCTTIAVATAAVTTLAQLPWLLLLLRLGQGGSCRTHFTGTTLCTCGPCDDHMDK